MHSNLVLFCAIGGFHDYQVFNAIVVPVLIVDIRTSSILNKSKRVL